MTVAASSIANLKTVDTSTGKKLRWVEDKNAWYQYNPASSETDDDDNIVLPNSNVGRWYKQEAKITTNGLSYNTVNGTQTITATPSNLYAAKSTTGPITINLPASPIAGDTVKVIHISSGLGNTTKINRNGKPIRGSTSSDGIELYTSGATALLTYIDSTMGWVFENELGYRILAVYGTTFTYTANGDDDGLFYWLGTAELTTSWSNPASSKVKVVYGDNTVNISATARNNSDNNFPSVSRGGAGIYIFLNIDVSTREFRLSDLSVQASGNANLAWRNFVVQGCYASDILSNSAMFTQAGANWKTLARFTNNTSMGTGAYAWGNYSVNSEDFYSAYRLLVNGAPSNNDAVPNDLWFSEIEFYGDVRS
jgi:hypothetical protein